MVCATREVFFLLWLENAVRIGGRSICFEESKRNNMQHAVARPDGLLGRLVIRVESACMHFRCNKWMGERDWPEGSFLLSSLHQISPGTSADYNRLDLHNWRWLEADRPSEIRIHFDPMFIFLRRRCSLPGERLCPPRDPSNQTSCCSTWCPQLPGDVSWEGSESMREGKKEKAAAERGGYIFARVVHQWDEETNCIFRRVRSVNTVSSSKRTKLPPPVLYARNVCVAKGSQRGEGGRVALLPPQPLPIRSQRG